MDSKEQDIEVENEHHVIDVIEPTIVPSAIDNLGLSQKTILPSSPKVMAINPCASSIGRCYQSPIVTPFVILGHIVK